MSAIDTYNKLRKRVDALKGEISREQGRADEIMARMKKEFNCDDIDAAKNLLEKKTAQLKDAEADLASKLADFETKWGERLR